MAARGHPPKNMLEVHLAVWPQSGRLQEKKRWETWRKRQVCSVVLAERVPTIRTIVKDSRTFVRRAQLEGMEHHLRVSASRARFIDRSSLLRGPLVIITQRRDQLPFLPQHRWESRGMRMRHDRQIVVYMRILPRATRLALDHIVVRHHVQKTATRIAKQQGTNFVCAYVRTPSTRGHSRSVQSRKQSRGGGQTKKMKKRGRDEGEVGGRGGCDRGVSDSTHQAWLGRSWC